MLILLWLDNLSSYVRNQFQLQPKTLKEASKAEILKDTHLRIPLLLQSSSRTFQSLI